MTPASFRQIFGSFSDPGPYPDIILQYFIDMAGTFLSPDRWGTALDIGTGYYVAHHLVLWARDERAVAAGGVGGEVKGVLTARSVDKVSQSWDASSVTDKDATFWNQTSYGLKFWQMAKGMGAGGLQL